MMQLLKIWQIQRAGHQRDSRNFPLRFIQSDKVCNQYFSSLYNDFPLDLSSVLRNTVCKLVELKLNVWLDGLKIVIIVSAARYCRTLKRLTLEHLSEGVFRESHLLRILSFLPELKLESSC